MAHKSNASQVLGATLVGGLAGAGLALLFAPRSGRETREILQKDVDRAKAAADEKISHAKSTVQKGLDKAKDVKGKLSSKEDESGIKDNKSRRADELSSWEGEI